MQTRVGPRPYFAGGMKYLPDELPVCVHAAYQEKGRGQGSNHWHSSSGLNILASYAFEPENLDASRGFYISKLTALAVLDTLSSYLPAIVIKWPNDLLKNEKKIAGILIENSLWGNRIKRSIAGIGVNLNQEEFPRFDEGLPATSLLLETKHKVKPEEFLYRLITNLEFRIDQLNDEYTEVIDRDYFSKLYRFGQWGLYKAGEESFEAMITGIEEDGHLRLQTREGETRHYAFKEVSFLLTGI